MNASVVAPPPSSALPAPPTGTAVESRAIALDTALLCGALLLPTATAAWLDIRTLDGVSVWAKPLKFQVSFALHWLTIAWLLSTMAAREREQAGTVHALHIGGFAAVIEILYITLQAARGRHSHFNFTTPLETLLYYALMGGAALVMMLATAWVGWRVLRHPALRDGRWWGAVAGLLGGSIVTLLTTAPLAAGIVDGPGHWVGGIRSDAGGLPLFGWSTTGGDLRVPHFFAAHLIQAAPIAGWLADRLRPRAARHVVWATFATGVTLVVATMVQAVAGRPLLG